MLYKRQHIEVMAPVGSFESLAAAVQAKADSVYFGIEQLNMRAKSSNNFTTEDLKEIVRICNENSIRSYLTVNTIIYDHDIILMKTDLRYGQSKRTHCYYRFRSGSHELCLFNRA
jgi:putative protease